MLVVGLTGGIGSGKSTVADRFAELGVPVIDADLVSRELTRPGMPALKAIAEAFGPQVMAADGELDRGALRQLIFERPERRKRLEAILHPAIRSAMLARLQQQQADYVVMAIPLLLETRQTDLVERILVVDLPEDLQMQRAARRDHQSSEQIQAIMATQCRRDERLAAADDVIDNSGSLQRLLEQTDRMHRRYMSLSRNR